MKMVMANSGIHVEICLLLESEYLVFDKNLSGG